MHFWKLETWVSKVTAGVAILVIGFGLTQWVTHFAVAGETADLAKETAKTTVKMGELLNAIGKRFEDQDAKAARDAELCHTGQLDDCTLCAAVGVPAPCERDSN